MEPMRIVIEDMPGPAVWEFLMQWGSLAVQVVAAVATVWAVVVALQSSHSMHKREDQRRKERAKFALAAVTPELKRLRARLSDLLVHLDTVRKGIAAKHAAELPYSPPKHIIEAFRSASVSLSTPLLTGMRSDLVDLESSLAIDAVTAETSLPQIVSWLERLAKYEGPWFDAGLGGLAEVAMEGVGDCGCRIDRLLVKAGVVPLGNIFQRFKETGTLQAPK